MAITRQDANDYITARSQRIHAHKKRFPYPEGCATSDLEQYCKDNNLG